MNMILRKKVRLTKNQKGMTLIELLAVVVILGILAAVAGAAVVGGFDKAKTNADASSVAILQDAAQRWILDTNPVNTTTSVTTTVLKNLGYIKAIPKSADGQWYTTVNFTINGGVISFSAPTKSATEPTTTTTTP